MTDDYAAELAALRARLAVLEDTAAAAAPAPAKGATRTMTEPRNIVRRAPEGEPWFRQEDLADAAFYREHEAAIHDALRHGRIIPSPKTLAADPKSRSARRNPL